MRKKKWKKIIIWSASIIILLGIGGLFAANYVVDRLIASLADSLENEIIKDITANGDNPSSVTNNPEPTAKPNTDKSDNDHTPATEQPGGNDSGNSSGDSDSPGNNSEAAKPTDGYSAEVSVDKAKDVQEKITVGEKAQLTSTLLKELSMSDIKHLQELASGGLSVEEKKEARSLILERLSPEQYDELIQIAKKYGLSQGKSYDEVSKED